MVGGQIQIKTFHTIISEAEEATLVFTLLPSSQFFSIIFSFLFHFIKKPNKQLYKQLFISFSAFKSSHSRTNDAQLPSE